MRRINRRWLLGRAPRGPLTVGDFARGDEELSDAALLPGQVLVRNRLYVCAPTTRTFFDPSDQARHRVAVGEPVLGPLGGVVEASAHPRFPVGTALTTFGPWADWAVLEPDGGAAGVFPTPPGATMEEALGLYGMSSCTAYFGLTRVARVQAGETVVVSGAAGSIGSMVVQLARLQGARVVGIAGGRAKGELVVGRLGAHAAIDYKGEDVGARLREVCPDGVDVYFDNVGGPLLEVVVAQLREGARVALCGQTATYDGQGGGTGLRDLLPLIYRGITLRGFNLGEFMTELEVARADLARWHGEGRLEALVDVRGGFEALPEAFVGLFKGQSLGTLLVRAEG